MMQSLPLRNKEANNDLEKISPVSVDASEKEASVATTAERSLSDDSRSLSPHSIHNVMAGHVEAAEPVTQLLEPWFQEAGPSPFDKKQPTGLCWLAVPESCPGIAYRVVNGTTLQALDVSKDGFSVLATVSVDSPVLHLCCSNDATLVACTCADGSLQLFTVEPFQGFLPKWKVKNAHSHVMNDTGDSSFDWKAGFSSSTSGSSVRSMCFSGQFLLLVDALRYQISIYHVANPRNLVTGTPLSRISVLSATWAGEEQQNNNREVSLLVGDTQGAVHLYSLNKKNGILSFKWQQESYVDGDGATFCCCHLHHLKHSNTILAGFYRMSENPLVEDAWHDTILCVLDQDDKTTSWKKVGCLTSIAHVPTSCRPTIYTSEIMRQGTLLIGSNVSAGVQLLVCKKDQGRMWDITHLQHNHSESTGIEKNDQESTRITAITRETVYSVGKAVGQASSGGVDCLFVLSTDGTLATFKLPHTASGVNQAVTTERPSRQVQREDPSSQIVKAEEAFQVTRVRRYRSSTTGTTSANSNANWLAVPVASVGLAYRVIEGNTIQAIMVSDNDVCHVSSTKTSQSIDFLACSADGGNVAVAHADGTVVLYQRVVDDNALERKHTLVHASVESMAYFDAHLFIVANQKVFVYSGDNEMLPIESISVSCAAWGLHDSTDMGIPLAVGDTNGYIRIYGVDDSSVDARSMFPYPRKVRGFVCAHVRFFAHHLFACFIRQVGQMYETIAFVADVSTATYALYNWNQVGESILLGKRPSFYSSVKDDIIALGMTGSNAFHLFYVTGDTWSWQAVRIPGSLAYPVGISWAYLGSRSCTSRTLLVTTTDGTMSVIHLEPSSSSGMSLDRVETALEWRRLKQSSNDIQGEEAVSSPPKQQLASNSHFGSDQGRAETSARNPSSFVALRTGHEHLKRENSRLSAELDRTHQNADEVLSAERKSRSDTDCQLQRLKETLKRRESEVVALKSSLSNAEEARQKSEEQQAILQIDVQTKAAEISAFSCIASMRATEKEELKEQVRSLQERKRELKEQVASLAENDAAKSGEIEMLSALNAAEKESLLDRMRMLEHDNCVLEQSFTELQDGTADVEAMLRGDDLMFPQLSEEPSLKDQVQKLLEERDELVQQCERASSIVDDALLAIGDEAESDDNKPGQKMLCAIQKLSALAAHSLAEREKLDTRFKGLQDEVATKTERLEANQREFKTLENRLEIAESERAHLDATKSKLQIEINLLVDKNQQEKDDLTSRCKELQDTLEAGTSQNETRRKTLETQLEHAKQKGSEASSLVDQLKTEKLRLLGELSTRKQENEESQVMLGLQQTHSQEEMERISLRLRECEGELASFKTLESKARAQLTSLDVEKKNLQSKLDASETEKESMKQRNLDLENVSLRIAAEKTKAEICIQELKSELQEGSETLLALRADTIALTERNAEIQAARERSDAEQKLLLVEVGRLRELGESRLKEKQILVSNLQKVKDEMREESERYEGRLKSSVAELQDMKTWQAEVKGALDREKDEKQTLFAQVESLSALAQSRLIEKEKSDSRAEALGIRIQADTELFESKLRARDAELLNERKDEIEAVRSQLESEMSLLTLENKHLSSLAIERLNETNKGVARIQVLENKAQGDAERFAADRQILLDQLQALECRSTDTEAALVDLKMETSRLLAENDRLCSISQERLSEKDELAALITALETKIRDELRAHEVELEALQQSTSNEIVEKSQLMGENERLSSLVDAAQREKEKVEASMQTVQMEMRAESERLEAELRARELEFGILNDKIDEIEADRSQLELEKRQLLAETDRLSSLASVRMAETREVEARIRGLEQKARVDAESFVSDARARDEQLQDLKCRETDTETALADTKVERSRLVVENERLRSLSEERMSEKVELEARIVALTQELRGYEERQESYRRSHESKLRTLQQSQREIESTLASADNENSHLTAENERLQSQLKLAEGEKERTEKDMQTLQQQTKEETEHVKSVIKAREEELGVFAERRVQAAIGQAKLEKSELSATIDRLSSSLAAEKEEADRAILALKSQQADTSESNELKLASLRTNLAETETRCDTLQAETSTLQAKLENVDSLSNARQSVLQETVSSLRKLHFEATATWEARLKDNELELESLRASNSKLSMVENEMLTLVSGIKRICSSARADLLCLLSQSDKPSSSDRTTFSDLDQFRGRFCDSGDMTALESTIMAFDDLEQLTSNGRCDCCGKVFCSEFQELFSGTSLNGAERGLSSPEPRNSPSPRASKGLRLGTRVRHTSFHQAQSTTIWNSGKTKQASTNRGNIKKYWSSSFRWILLLSCCLPIVFCTIKLSDSSIRMRVVTRLRSANGSPQRSLLGERRGITKIEPFSAACEPPKPTVAAAWLERTTTASVIKPPRIRYKRIRSPFANCGYTRAKTLRRSFDPNTNFDAEL